MTDDELDAAMTKSVIAPYIEPTPFEGDEVVEDHAREMEASGLDTSAQEAVAASEPKALGKDVPSVVETPPYAPKPPALGGREPAFSRSRQGERTATTDRDSSNKQMSPAVLQTLRGQR